MPQTLRGKADPPPAQHTAKGNGTHSGRQWSPHADTPARRMGGQPRPCLGQGASGSVFKVKDPEKRPYAEKVGFPWLVGTA